MKILFTPEEAFAVFPTPESLLGVLLICPRGEGYGGEILSSFQDGKFRYSSYGRNTALGSAADFYEWYVSFWELAHRPVAYLMKAEVGQELLERYQGKDTTFQDAWDALVNQK